MEYFSTFLNGLWEDVVYKYIFPRLEISHLFILSATSTTYRKMVLGYFAKLKTVNVGRHGSKINVAALRTLLAENHLCEKLILRGCNNSLVDEILEPMLRRNLQISYVDITDCTSLTDKSILAVATSCKGLKHISLEGCVWATDPAVTNLGLHCLGLEFIDLSGCWNISDETISVISSVCQELKDVILSRIYGITDLSVTSLAKNSKYLRHLGLKDCWRVSDDGIWMLLEFCKNLQVVQIKGCRSVSWRMMDSLKKKGIAHDCEGLQAAMHLPAGLPVFPIPWPPIQM